MLRKTSPISEGSLQLRGLSKQISARGRLQALHGQLLQSLPEIDRIACSVYDASDDTLTAFINSDRRGSILPSYQFKLAESSSLSLLAQEASVRMLDDLSHTLQPESHYTQVLLATGFQSSFTVPMYDQRGLLGFIFFDSLRLHAFPEKTQRDLLLYCNLISMAVSCEVEAIRSLRASTHLAFEFAHLRDFETGAHLQRMSHYAKLIAGEVSAHYGLSDEFVEHLYWFAPLHDIGKIGIPDRILLKQGSLNVEEQKIMESHVEKGIEIVTKLIEEFELSDFPDAGELVNIVGCHHEFLDGTGYPDGLMGDQVPVSARIVAVADIYDALTTIRPYKKPWSHADAMVELQRMADDGKLDQHCVVALIKIEQKILEIRDKFQDGQIYW